MNDLVPSPTIAKQTLYFSRLCTYFQWKNLNEKLQKELVEAHGTLCTFFGKSKSKALYDKNYKCLKRTFLSFTESQLSDYISILKSTNSTVQVCILWDNLVRFVTEQQKLNYHDSNKDIILDAFIKNIILSKVKITDTFGSFCFSNTISLLKFDDFKATFFPSLQKAILRSAETSLALIAFLFGFVNFDLSELSQGILQVYINLKV